MGMQAGRKSTESGIILAMTVGSEPAGYVILTAAGII